MAHLAEDGISGIMLEAISAPDQVLSALCTQANIHRVLIGNYETEQQITQGLLERLCRRGGGGEGGGGGGGGGGAAVAYTKREDGVVVQHRGRISRYGSNTFSTVSKLCRDAQLLGAGGREEEEARELARREAEEVIAANREKAATLLAEIRDMEEEQNTAGREATKLRKEQEKMQTQLREATGAQNYVRRLKNKLAEIEAEMEKGVSDQRAELEKGTRAAARAYVDALANQTEEVAELVRRWEANVGGRMTQAMVKPLSRGADQELQEQGQKHAGLKQEAELLNSQYRTLMDAMKKTKAILMREIPITGEVVDEQVVAMFRKELACKTPEECQDMYEEAMQRADSIYDNPEVVAQYKELVKQAAARELELAQHTGTCNSGQRKVEELAKKWTDALRPLVAKLHVRFAEYMRQMGCEGEVTLAEEPDDYERWGLVLRVRFREGTTLQPLQAKVQSGGERSVSTILFLMGLQSTVASPFRAVDEINQGMDERNERLVFSRIVANSANVQYFLVTPKLLPGLTAMEMEHVTVLFVFNAPELLPFDEWNVKSFLEAARRKRAAAGGEGGGGASKRGRFMGASAARKQELVEIDDD
jgi:chromosome segregation ATPase